MEQIKNFFSLMGSYLIAIARLFFWLLVLLVSGLQKILFCRVEICGVEVRCFPLRCDRDEILNNVSYIEKLNAENPELAEIVYSDEDEEFHPEEDDNTEGD